jgi:hypothetical protein
MAEQQTFAFIYNLPEPSFVLLWPNWYEKDKEYLDANYDVITEYNIKNLGWSAWLVNNQPFIVLNKKDLGEGEKVTSEVKSLKTKKK